jgi:hypothetical protein
MGLPIFKSFLYLRLKITFILCTSGMEFHINSPYLFRHISQQFMSTYWLHSEKIKCILLSL